MAKETVAVSGGIGVGGLAFIVLLVLKLMDQIALGWGWVLTSFLWVPLIMLLVCVAIAMAILFVIACMSWIANRL